MPLAAAGSRTQYWETEPSGLQHECLMVPEGTGFRILQPLETAELTGSAGRRDARAWGLISQVPAEIALTSLGSPIDRAIFAHSSRSEGGNLVRLEQPGETFQRHR